MPEKYVHVDGMATFVHHVGPTTLPERPPDLSRGETIVCLHCAAGNARCSASCSRGSAPAHSPLAFDLPGHARSGGLDSLGSIARMARRSRARSATAFGDRALRAARRSRWAAWSRSRPRSRRPSSCAGSCWSRARARVRASARRAARAAAPGHRGQGAARVRPRAATRPSATPDVMRRGFMEDLKTDPRVLLPERARGCAASTARRTSRASRCPTLVVVGRGRCRRRARAADAARARHPAARARVVIPKCGHRVAARAARARSPSAVLDVPRGARRDEPLARGRDRRRATSTRPAGRRTRPSSRSWPSARAARSTTAGSTLARRRRPVRAPACRWARWASSTLAEYLNLKPRYLDGTNIGGSSFVAHVAPRRGRDPRRAVRGRARSCTAARPRRTRSRSAPGMGGGGATRRVVRRALRHDHGRQLRARRAAPHAALRHDLRAARRDRRHHAAPRGAEPGAPRCASRSPSTTCSRAA